MSSFDFLSCKNTKSPCFLQNSLLNCLFFEILAIRRMQISLLELIEFEYNLQKNNCQAIFIWRHLILVCIGHPPLPDPHHKKEQMHLCICPLEIQIVLSNSFTNNCCYNCEACCHKHEYWCYNCCISCCR